MWFKSYDPDCKSDIETALIADLPHVSVKSGFWSNGPYRPLLLYFLIFTTVDDKQIFNTDFANDWYRTTDVWCQLSHNYNNLNKIGPNNFMGGGRVGDIAECDVVVGCVLFGSECNFQNKKMHFYIIFQLKQTSYNLDLIEKISTMV